jgi:hypothetical protein
VTTPALITQEDLEEHYPPQFVLQVFADTGKNEVGPRCAVACAVATRQGESVCLKAWPAERIPTLVAEDEAVKSAFCDLAMFEGVKGKPQWSGPGAPYANLRKDALASLELLAAGQLRSIAEGKGAGANPNRKGNIASPDCPPRMFAPTRARPKPGGY